MRLGILAYGNPTFIPKAKNIKPIVKAARARGHRVTIIPERYLAFDFGKDKKILFKNKPLPKFDAILVRAGFLNNPSIHSAVIKQFQLAGCLIINSDLGVHRCKNKLRMLQLLDHFDFPIPKTRAVFDYKHIEHITEEFKFPIIIKTVYGSLGVGVMMADSKRLLVPIVEHIISSTSLPILVQEYIKEAKGKDLRVFTVGKKVIAAMERVAKRGDFRANFSAGGKVNLAELTEEEIKMSIDSAKQLGLHTAGVDIIRTNDGPKILEVNSNPGLEGITQATGVDVSTEIVKYIERKVSRRKRKIKK